MVVVIGGPNGAGKTSAAQKLLPEGVRIREYLNADEIAAGLSPFQPRIVQAWAGRLMLERFDQLVQTRADFAFESTLSGLGFARRLMALRQRGYRVVLIYLWLRSADLAVARVQQRMAAGGHEVPEPVIRRRFGRSAVNFVHLYQPLADLWLLCDNSMAHLRRIADGRMKGAPKVYDKELYEAFGRLAGAAIPE